MYKVKISWYLGLLMVNFYTVLECDILTSDKQFCDEYICGSSELGIFKNHLDFRLGV